MFAQQAMVLAMDGWIWDVASSMLEKQYHGGLLSCQVEAVWETKAEPNVISISCVGSAMEKAGEWQQTLTLLGDMQVTWVEHHWSHGLNCLHGFGEIWGMQADTHGVQSNWKILKVTMANWFTTSREVMMSPFAPYRSAPSDGPPKSCGTVAPCSVNLRTALCCPMWWPTAQQLVPVLGEVNGSVHLQKLGLKHLHQEVSESFEILSRKMKLVAAGCAYIYIDLQLYISYIYINIDRHLL